MLSIEIVHMWSDGTEYIRRKTIITKYKQYVVDSYFLLFLFLMIAQVLEYLACFVLIKLLPFDASHFLVTYKTCNISSIMQNITRIYFTS